MSLAFLTDNLLTPLERDRYTANDTVAVEFYCETKKLYLKAILSGTIQIAGKSNWKSYFEDVGYLGSIVRYSTDI